MEAALSEETISQMDVWVPEPPRHPTDLDVCRSECKSQKDSP